MGLWTCFQVPHCGFLSISFSNFLVLNLPTYTRFKFLTDPEFVSGLRHRFQRRKQAEENIEDVYDGNLYKDQFQNGGVLSQPFNMSFKLNTDGVAVFKSSKFGVWPLFLSINELPPQLRYLYCIIVQQINLYTCTSCMHSNQKCFP